MGINSAHWIFKVDPAGNYCECSQCGEKVMQTEIVNGDIDELLAVCRNCGRTMDGKDD